MQKVLGFFIAVIFLAGCGLRERETALEKKEAALLQREQELVLREQSLLLREQSFRDSILLARDTVKPDSLTERDTRIEGAWNVKMTCTETSCPGSAIGDTRSEVWIFSFQDNALLARVMDGEKLVRIYTGKLVDNNIEMEEASSASAAPSDTKMIIRLSVKNDRSMEGQREILRNVNCRILYALQLTRQ
jgi:hypothetical protein